jgi:hypothetical protein
MAERRGETFVMEGSPEGAISFSTFVLSLASTTMIHLGEAPNPETGKAAADLLMARQTLDLLALLREKTRGNLSADEEQLFASVLTDLRLKFVGKSGA